MIQTKVLIVFQLENAIECNQYKLVIRYCSISELANSVSNLHNKYNNYLIFKFYIIGVIQENVLTMQLINNKKLIIFNENIKENKILSEHSESMNELLKLDNKFNELINKKIQYYLNKKVLEYKTFKKEKLCKELEEIYNNYSK